MINQLQEKYQLSLLLLLASVAICGVSPYVVSRYLEGNYTSSLIDLSLILGIIVLVSLAYYTKKIRILSALIAVFINVGVVVVVVKNGYDSFFWVYPVFASIYILLKPLEAFIVNILAGISLLLFADILTFMSLDSFIITTLMLTMSAFVYSNHSLKQFRLLETLNTIDDLTGAFNRRALKTDIDEIIASSERRGDSPLLAILDLDYFKKVNDEFGHAVGDKVLKDFVAITKANIRKYDRLYRFGGEEFVLLVSDIEGQQQNFIDNLRKSIKKELKTPNNKSITVSFGVATWIPNTTADSWLKRADKVLYQAKENGRDCAVFSNE
ncbi:GGDEF domain-containing protein [Thalassotalea profundi]|uniref:diguanylate cyclase n=1 Tax=Thalassotalea profundi TaxID=2036687 RepID=A0ABQ3IIU1_9GAMM|nr:GGDEF domain-containing protein [Thalassotalea profundi]GHE83082.1 hypothetical protein GCM10011501_09310 [Thalassotalea profundi]